MELKDSIKELSNGNGKVLGDIARKIKELQTDEYILNVHLIKNTLLKIASDNKIPDLMVLINKNYSNRGFYFTSEVCLVDGVEELYSKENSKLKKEINNMDQMLSIAVDGVYATSDKWLGVGDPINELVIDLSNPITTEVEDWFFSKELRVKYDAANLAIEFEDKEKNTVKPKKHKI